jgi:hypothetical protein
VFAVGPAVTVAFMVCCLPAAREVLPLSVIFLTPSLTILTLIVFVAPSKVVFAVIMTSLPAPAFFVVTTPFETFAYFVFELIHVTALLGTPLTIIVVFLPAQIIVEGDALSLIVVESLGVRFDSDLPQTEQTLV